MTDVGLGSAFGDEELVANVGDVASFHQQGENLGLARREPVMLREGLQNLLVVGSVAFLSGGMDAGALFIGPTRPFPASRGRIGPRSTCST